MKKLMILLVALLPFAAVQAQKPQPTPTLPPPTMTAIPEPEDKSDELSVLIAESPQDRLEDGGFVVGDPDAPITIVEFADWACSHCQDYREIIEPVLLDYLPEGLVRYEFRAFPTAGGETTLFAAQVAECADVLREGGFWQSYEILYAVAINRNYSVGGIIETISSELDLDEDELLDCTQDAFQIASDIELGIALGVNGTPAVLVRYGDSEPEFIVFEGETYDLGGVPEDVLRAVIEEAQVQEMLPTPTNAK